MKIMKYTRTPGAKISEKEAAIFGRELKKLSDKNNGMLTNELVVAAAQNPASPLAGFFEWNDTKAANRYRLKQANQLINYIGVVVIIKGKKYTLPFMESVRVEIMKVGGETETVRRYVTVKTIEKEKGARDSVAEDAKSMLEEALTIIDRIRLLAKKRKNPVLTQVARQIRAYIKTL